MTTSIRSLPGSDQPKKAYIPALLRHRMIVEMTYFIARKRGYAAGYELRDWFEAERVIAEHFPED